MKMKSLVKEATDMIWNWRTVRKLNVINYDNLII